MNQSNEALTDQEVHRISQLIESLDRSTLDYLQVDTGGVKVTISKGGAGLPSMASPAVAAAAGGLLTRPCRTRQVDQGARRVRAAGRALARPRRRRRLGRLAQLGRRQAAHPACRRLCASRSRRLAPRCREREPRPVGRARPTEAHERQAHAAGPDAHDPSLLRA
jgi:hypothetical protein